MYEYVNGPTENTYRRRMPSNESEIHAIDAAEQLNQAETSEPSLIVMDSNRLVRIWKLCLIFNVVCTVAMVIFVAILSTSFFNSLDQTYPQSMSGEAGYHNMHTQNEAYTKVLIATGYGKDGVLETVEVVDASDRNLLCNDLPPYPKATYAATGGLLGTTPVICGGKYEVTCYALASDKWKLVATMSFVRKYSASAVVGDKMLVIGGYNYRDTSDIVGLNTSKLGPTLPSRVNDPCAVALNESTIMIIGGEYQNLPSTTTWYYHLNIDHWIRGPALNTGRYEHSCAVIKSNDQVTIVVAGGRLEASVEVLPTGGTSEWSYVKPLPLKIGLGQLVPDATGNGVFMIGGWDYTNGNTLDTLHHMACVDCQWVKLQTLKTARRSHVAIPVPDDLVTCQ